MEFTTHLELQSQATRLVENTSWTATAQITNGILTLSDTVSQRIYTCAFAGRCFDRLQFSEEIDNLHFPRFSRPYWGDPC